MSGCLGFTFDHSITFFITYSYHPWGPAMGQIASYHRLRRRVIGQIGSKRGDSLHHLLMNSNEVQSMIWFYLFQFHRPLYERFHNPKLNWTCLFQSVCRLVMLFSKPRKRPNSLRIFALSMRGPQITEQHLSINQSIPHPVNWLLSK